MLDRVATKHSQQQFVAERRVEGYLPIGMPHDVVPNCVWVGEAVGPFLRRQDKQVQYRAEQSEQTLEVAAFLQAIRVIGADVPCRRRQPGGEGVELALHVRELDGVQVDQRGCEGGKPGAQVQRRAAPRADEQHVPVPTFGDQLRFQARVLAHDRELQARRRKLVHGGIVAGWRGMRHGFCGQSWLTSPRA